MLKGIVKKLVLMSFCIFLSTLAKANEVPVVYWASDPVRPDETMLVQGHLLSEGYLEIARLKDGWFTGKPAINCPDYDKLKKTKLVSMQPSEQTAKYLIPAGWKMGIYAIRPVKDGQCGKVRLVNAPDVWWLQGDRTKSATPGGWLKVFGKCVSFNNKAKLYLKSESGKLFKLDIQQQDRWHISSELPLGLTEGKYDVFVHNGFGGKYGWVDAGSIQIKEKIQWPQKVFNVVDYGAKPNFDPSRSRLDKTNDSPAFQQALDAAKANGGGVVYIPKGCYRLVEPLTVSRFVTIRGESTLGTNLGWTDKQDPPIGLINGSNNFAVEDLTIFVQNYYSVIHGDHGHIAGSGNIVVRRVCIRANRFVGVTNRFFDDYKTEVINRQWNVGRRIAALFFGGENIEITDCDVLASHNSVILDKANLQQQRYLRRWMYGDAQYSNRRV